MKRLCFVTTVLVTMSGIAAAAQIRPSILPPRKGLIQNAWVEPSAPTSSTPVSLYVSVADPLQIDKATLRRLSHRFVLSVWWTNAPAGAAGPASPGQHAQSLGTLSPGQYAVLIQSFYKGMLVDARTLVFQVH